MKYQPASRSAWTIPAWLCLLSLSILINYIDRGNLAVAAPLLKDELRISVTQIGILITAFFWTYTAVMAVSGWLVDRFDVNWVLAAGFILWSLATAATGLAHTFALLLAARMVLGLGESVAFPSFGKIIALNVPQQHRATANAMITSGMSLGPAVGTFACGMSMARYGWRPVFIVIGLVSLLWVLPWLRYKPRNAIGGARVSAPVSVLEIFRQNSFWGASVGHFCSNYPFYFMIVWLPMYLVRERHLTMQQMAREAALFYVAFAVMSPVAGWVADAFIRAGRDTTTVRKTSMAIGHSLVVAGVLMCSAADPHVLLAGLVVMGLGSGFIGPNIYVFAQTLAGPSVAGKWTGLQNCFGNFAGVVVGPLTGWIVDRTGHFESAFVICAIVSALGGIAWVMLVGRVEQAAWPAAVERLAIGEAA
ncbi:MAG TPA: MFS transporter [Terriglobales bacterium]|jgi:MFS family permease